MIIISFEGIAAIPAVHPQNKRVRIFKKELVDYLDYYNNCRSKAKLKGLPPALRRQQALEAA